MKFNILDTIFTISLLSLIIIYFLFYSLNVDSTWILYSANEIINGSILYKDIIDVNPPLIFMYSILPVLFSKITSLSLEHSYIVFVLFLLSLCLYLVSKVLNLYFYKNTNFTRYYLYSISLILTLCLTYDFGQREHLFMIFILPYIMMMLFKHKIKLRTRDIYFIAIFASLGFNIKPHFFLVFISMEFVYMIYTKNLLSIFRKESLIIISSAFFYLILIYIQFSEYIEFIIPLALDTYTNVFNKSYFFLLIKHEILLSFLVLLFYFAFIRKKMNYEIIFFFVMIITSLLIYILQQKGWAYHRVPMFIITLLFLTYITINLLNSNRKIYIIGFLPIIIFILILNIQSVPNFKELKDILRNLQSNSKVHIISTDIARGQALLVENNQIWTSRFPSIFMLPSLLEKENKKVQNYLFDSLYIDMKKHKPNTIIFCGKYTSFDYYKYFLNKDPRLKDLYETYYKKSIIDGYTILSKYKNFK